MYVDTLKINIDRRKIFPDVLAFIGFSLEFMFSGSLIGQIGFMMIIAAGCICLIQQYPLRIKICSFFMFYLFLAGYFQLELSLGNSIAPTVTSAYIGTMLKCFVYMVFAYQYLMKRDLRAITTFFLMLAVTLSLYMIFTGAIFSGNRLSGSGINANSVGMLLAVAICLVGYRIISKDYKSLPIQIVLCACFLFVIILSGSRKALFLCVIPLLLYYVFKNKRYMFWRVVVVCILVVLAYLLIMNVPAFYDAIGARIDGFLTALLGGKTEDASVITRNRFVTIGIAAFLQRPWTGYGLASFSSLAGSYGTYSHNNYIELLVAGGIPALVLFYAPYVFLLKKLYRRHKTSNACLFFLFFVISQLILHTGFVMYFSRTQLFILLFIFSLAAKRENENAVN